MLHLWKELSVCSKIIFSTEHFALFQFHLMAKAMKRKEFTKPVNNVVVVGIDQERDTA